MSSSLRRFDLALSLDENKLTMIPKSTQETPLLLQSWDRASSAHPAAALVQSVCSNCRYERTARAFTAARSAQCCACFSCAALAVAVVSMGKASHKVFDETARHAETCRLESNQRSCRVRFGRGMAQKMEHGPFSYN